MRTHQEEGTDYKPKKGGEPTQEHIKSVGTFFVTIVKPNGDQTKRAAKNKQLIHDE